MNEILNQFSSNTTIGQYLDSLKKMNDEYNQKLFEEIYLPIIQKEKKEKDFFLSVIIRTQGKREDGLREALLCLTGQSNQDFEIIIIAHKASEEGKKVVENILEEQSDEFRKKIRYFELDTGTRTAPLNFGFAHAWGNYVAVFDDDDILFDNWVESFWKCSRENAGRILHSFAFAQNWTNLEMLGYRADAAPIANYCSEFNLLLQLTVNRCPLMSLAFPTYIFQKVGMIFNESLNVTEDWEYFMRTAFLCGVSDICEPTAIYRFWNNVETSATLHEQVAWDDTYKKIQDTFNEKNIILPPDNVKQIIGWIEKVYSDNVVNSEGDIVSQLFYSKENGFDNQRVLRAANKKSYPMFELWFLFDEKTNENKVLRFDLCEEGLFALKNLEIIIWFTNGENKVLDLKDCVHNGLNYKDGALFINEDPEIIWELEDNRKVDVININGEISRKIPRIPLLDLVISVFPVKKILKKRKLHKKGCF